MIYIIDHNDSFTYNVVHQFSLYDDVECDNYNSIDENIKLINKDSKDSKDSKDNLSNQLSWIDINDI